MKKKIWAICLTLVLALAAFAISGCSLFNDVGTISWVKEPAKVYTLHETDKPSFELKAELKKGETINVTYPNGQYDSQIEVKNFTTATVGTRTATVTFEKLTLSFSYKVIDGNFADGTGAETDPYLVATKGQFQNMLNQKSFGYYKLTNNIDFTGTAINMANDGAAAADKDAWVGVLDGNGYIVSGISQVRTKNGEISNKYNEVFGKVSREKEKFVLKNITFDFASTGESATMGLVTCFGDKGVLEFNNVKVTGYLNAANTSNSNVAPFVTFMYRGSKYLGSLNITNCVSDIKIYNSYAIHYVSGFIAGQSADSERDKYYPLSSGNIKFENSKFTGYIEGAKVVSAAFMTSKGDPSKIYTFNACSVGTEAEGTKIIKATSICGEVAYTDGKTSGVYNYDKENGNSDEYKINKIIDTSLKTVDIKVTGDDLECSVVGDTADDYKVFSLCGMGYTYLSANGSHASGSLKFVQPVDKTKVVGGKLTQTLLKIRINADGTTENTDTKYGSNLFVLENGAITYYGKSVFCNKLSFKDSQGKDNCEVIVVAYKEGKAIAIGTKGGLNFDANK